jgi:hypothetical protein
MKLVRFPPRDARPINLLCAFSVSTNFAERKIALEEARLFNKAHILNNPISPSKYRKLSVELEIRFIPSREWCRLPSHLGGNSILVPYPLYIENFGPLVI